MSNFDEDFIRRSPTRSNAEKKRRHKRFMHRLMVNELQRVHKELYGQNTDHGLHWDKKNLISNIPKHNGGPWEYDVKRCGEPANEKSYRLGIDPDAKPEEFWKGRIWTWDRKKAVGYDKKSEGRVSAPESHWQESWHFQDEGGSPEEGETGPNV